MATEADISDHISPLKVEVEDNQGYSEISKVAPEELIEVEDKVESSFIQPLETKKTVEENVTDLGDVCLVSEGFIKAIEGEIFLPSPQVADKKVEKMDDEQLNSNEKSIGSDIVDKIEMNTDENVVVDSNLDQDARPVIEPTYCSQPLEDSFHKVENFEISKQESDLAVKDMVEENLKNKPEALMKECKNVIVLEETPEHEEHLELEQSIVHKNETETENVEMFVTEASEEIETTPSSEIPDQIPEKQDKETLSADVEASLTLEEKNSAAIDLDEKNEAAEVAETDKSGNDSNATSPLVKEEVLMISEKPNQVPKLKIEGQVLEEGSEGEQEGKGSNEVIQTETSFNENANDQIIKDEEFEDPEATNEGENIEQGLKDETLIDHTKEGNSESLVSCMQENETVPGIRKEEEVELSTPEDPENKIKNGTEKSDDVSRLASPAPPDEIYEENLEDTKNCLENVDIAPPTVTETTTLPEVKPGDKPLEAVEVESSCAVSEPRDQKFEEIHQTATSSSAEEIEKVSENNEIETLELATTTDSGGVEEIKEIQGPITGQIPTEEENELLSSVPETVNKVDRIEAQESLVSQTKTEFNVLAVEEIHESQTTAAVEKTHTNKDDERTKDALEITPESKGQDEKVIEQEILSNRNLPLESVEGANDGVEETDITPKTKSEVTNHEEIKLNDEAAEKFDMRSEFKTSDTIEAVETCEQDSEVENIKPAEAYGSQGKESDGTNEISPNRMSLTENRKEEAQDLPSNFLSSEESQENETTAIKPTEDDSSKLHETTAMLSQLQNIETGEASFADEVKAGEMKGSDTVCGSKDSLKEIHETEINPPAEISEENVEEKTECHEGTDIAVTSGTEVTILGESKLINEPIDAFGTSSKTITPETIETLDAPKHVSRDDDIKLEEASSMECQLLAHENEAEVENSELPAKESESLVHNVEEIHDTDTDPVVGDTETCEIENTNANKEEEKEKEALETTPESKGQNEKIIEQEILSSRSFPLETVESAKVGVEETDTTPTTASEVTSGEEIKLNDESVKNFDMYSDSKSSETIEAVDTCELDSEVENHKPAEASMEESKLAEDVSKIEAGESVTAAKTEADNVEVERQKVLGSESESLEVEEIQEANAGPAETGTTGSEKEVQETPKSLPGGINQGPESDGTDEISPSRTSQTENIKEEARDLSSNFLSSEESQENETTTIKPTEDDSSKLQQTSVMLSQHENIETGEASFADEVKDEEVMGSDTVYESKDCLEEIRETVTTPPPEISEENIEEKTECHEGTDIAVTTGTEVTILGESKLINEPIDAFGTSSETTAPETIETVDAPKHVSKADDIKLEEASSMESQLLAHENEAEVENSELPAKESESLVHNFEEIRDTDTDPVVGDTETCEIEKLVTEIPEVINQADTVNHNVEAVVDDDDANEQPLSNDDFEEHQESSSVLFSEIQEETEETLVSQTKTESNVLGVEEFHETETTAAVENTHANKEEEKEKEALETTPESKGQDEKIIEQEILSSRSFPLETGESAKVGVEETDTTPTTASEVTSGEEIKLNDESMKNFDMYSDSKSSETIEAVDTCEQDSEVENLKPAKVSMEESKLAEDTNKIEAGESVTAAKTEADNVEVESQKVLGSESESLEVEEIQEVNAGPAETGTTESEKEVQEAPSRRDLSSNFISREENETITIKPTEDDSSKLQQTSVMLSQHENIETGEASFTDEVKDEEVIGSDTVCESKDCLEEIHETVTTPPPEISEENIDEKTECHKGTDIAVTTGTEVTILGESKLIKEPIDTFGTSLETTSPETIETVDAPKHVSKADDIKLEEASSMESQLLAHENEAEVENSELPAKESESSVHDVEEIHDTDTGPVVGDTETCEIEKVVREVPEVINQADTVIHNVEAVIDDDANEQPLSNDDFEEHQESSSVLFSEIQEETEETLVSQTKTESNVLGVEEFHETETTAAVENNHANKEEEKEKEALETTPESKGQDEKIIEQEILSTRSFSLETVESAKVGVEEIDTTPTTASEVTSGEEIMLNDESVKNLDMYSDSKTSEKIEAVDTCELDSEVENLQPAEASMEESKLAEDVNKIEAGESVTAAKTEADDESQKVLGSESESLEVEEIQEANAGPAETGTTGSEKEVQEAPKPLPGGMNQGPESDGTDEISPSRTSKTETIKEEAWDLSSNLLSSEESQENETTTIKPTEDDSLKLQQTSGMLSQHENIETREASFVDEIKDEEVIGSDAVCESEDCLKEIHETVKTPPPEISEENIDEKTECHEGTDIAVTTETEVTILGESKINEPIDAFGTSLATTSPETIETVDAPKHVSKADDMKPEEASSMESQAYENEAEVENSELPGKESESLVHNVEEIHDTDTGPVVGDTKTCEIEKLVREVPEVINQADSVISQHKNIETAEESDVDVVKAEDATWFDEVCEPKEHLEEIRDTKASPNEEIFVVDEREEEIESVVEKIYAPTTPDVEAVIYEINDQPQPTSGLEEHQESSSVLLSKLDKTKENEVSETKMESNALQTTAIVEKTHADKAEETKEALETMSELKCQDVEAVIDREILSNKSFPLETIEGAKDEVEETDIAPKTASEVTSIGEVKLSDEVVKEAHISFDSTTPETKETADICQQDSEVESNKPEEASIVEPKLAEHENKIEAHENVTAAKAESDGAKVENQKVLGAEVECSSFEEIHEENTKPAVGETDTNESEEVVNELRINQGQEVESIKEEVQNSSSVFLPSEESIEIETTTTKNTEDDSFKLEETSGMLSQLQAIEPQDEVKVEEEKGFDVARESKDCLEEIHETETTPLAEISAEVKMEEETNSVAEKMSDIEAVVDNMPAAESTGVSTYPTEKADIDANIKPSAADEPEEAIVLESITSSRVLDVERIHGTETNPTVRQTPTYGEADETKAVLESTSKPDYDVAKIIDQTFPREKEEETKSGVEKTDIAPAAVTGEGSMGKINPSDEVAKPSNISSDIKTQEAIQIADTSVLDSEINKSQLQKYLDVQEIHETDMSPTVGESDADGSVSAFDVEESKSYIYVAEPNNQDIHETGTSPTNQVVEMIEIDQETRQAPETINKEINQDSLVVSKYEIAPNQPTEAEKIQEQEKGFDPVPESKDRNSVESLECKTIPTKEMEGYGTKSEFEIHGSEVDPILKVKDIVDEQLDKTVGNLGGGKSETSIANTIEAAQATHEIASKELFTEEPKKAEADNTLGETITSDNNIAEAPEQVSAVIGTASVSYEEEEKDEKFVEKEPIAENDGKECENLTTETRSTKEVKIPEVVLGNHENKLGDYNKDENAIAKINNNENNDEKDNMEHESHVPACEEICIKESVDIKEQEATTSTASDFSYSKTSEEELVDKGEITVDEKQRNVIQDQAPIIPSVEEKPEKLVVLPIANNQEAVGDVIETDEILKKPQEQEKNALSLSQEQVAKKEFLNEEKENMNEIASRDFQVIPTDPTVAKQVELCEEGKPGEKISESIEKLTQNDPAEVSSSEFLHKPREETKQATEEPNTEAEEKAQVEEERTDEEEEDEHKRADSGSDAPVMVEAPREKDVKTPHKKSHNILSGVGSKVKHSIAKVKKAITGKSSHQKASSQKEDKKAEAVPLL